MFNPKNIPHKYMIAGIIGLIAILLIVTLVQPADFRYRDTTDYAKRRQEAAAQAEQYQALLAAIDVSAEDSQVVLQKIATQDVVKQDVYDTLQVSQKITVPEIRDGELAFAPRGDKAAVEQYLQDTLAAVQDYNARTGIAHQTVFSGLQDKSVIDQAVAQTRALATALRQTPVPRDLTAYHKAKIIAYEQYADFLKTAEAYDPVAHTLVSPRGGESWPEVYKNYAVINNQATVIDTELQRVDQKYSLGNFRIRLADPSPADAGSLMAKLGLANEAEAFLGFGDLSITIGDIPSIIMYGVRQGMAKAFTTFVISSIDRLVAKIDKYFTITSQLYYSQELGKLYTKEYWKKFNVSGADQSIMRNFLPEYFCAPQSQADLDRLAQVFAAKSQQLLKYNIQSVPLNSPNYYAALNDLGKNASALIDPWTYWRDIYTAQSRPAYMAAADAVDKEIKGNGLKSGRDLLSGAINQNVNKILNVQQGSVTEALHLGNSNADNIVSTLIAGIFENLTTKFIFTAVSTGQRGGGLATVLEQPLCISTPKLQPVVPGAVSDKDLQAIEQAKLEECRALMQLYDQAVAQGATGLDYGEMENCRALLNQAPAVASGGPPR